MTNKEKFLVEHNKLSPINLKATLNILTVFKIKKPTLFKNNDWSIDKIRRPFIMWLTSMTKAQKEEINSMQK
ncbi:MAG: hypothetical protein ABIH48_02020 [Candidatus Falkowbacteria bacterium]